MLFLDTIEVWPVFIRKLALVSHLNSLEVVPSVGQRPFSRLD